MRDSVCASRCANNKCIYRALFERRGIEHKQAAALSSPNWLGYQGSVYSAVYGMSPPPSSTVLRHLCSSDAEFPHAWVLMGIERWYNFNKKRELIFATVHYASMHQFALQRCTPFLVFKRSHSCLTGGRRPMAQLVHVQEKQQ